MVKEPQRGCQIETLHDLWAASQNGQAVYCPESHAFRKHHAATFMLRQQGVVLFELIQMGLYVWIPAKDRKAGTNEN